MGIKHFSDLAPSDVISKLNQAWNVTLKVDGSFIQFGLDEADRFYTSRKGSDRFYHSDDWPDMPWCDSFRAAHDVLFVFVDGLKASNGAPDGLRPGDNFDAEVLWQSRPNTIRYGHIYNSILITRAPADVELVSNNGASGYPDWNKKIAVISVNEQRWHTDDGVELRKAQRRVRWRIFQLTGMRTIQSRYTDHLIHIKNTYRRTLKEWLDQPSKFEGVTKQALLECKVNRRPDFIPEDMWRSPARGLLVSQIKAHREILREEWNRQVRQDAAILLEECVDMLHYNEHDNVEGVVVRSEDGDLFKLVHREDFSRANRVSHWVRYALQGGSRPPRPSFVSRTRHWPVERRLARLEQLRRRYILNRHCLSYQSDKVSVSYECVDLHQRTLLLFAELKVRIQNGW